MGGADKKGISTVWKFNSNFDFNKTFVINMNHIRWNHACGIFNSKAHSWRPLVVVASGYGSGPKTSEFWDFTLPGSKWQLSSK